MDATSNSIFGYAGAVWAFGKNVSGEGLRVKGVTGTGGYDYGGSLPGVAGSVNFDGDVVLAQLLGGDVTVIESVPNVGSRFRVIVAVAGMAAHLAGVVASHTRLPVLGVPVPAGAFSGAPNGVVYSSRF